jgi:hypothetical protein
MLGVRIFLSTCFGLICHLQETQYITFEYIHLYSKNMIVVRKYGKNKH